MLHKAFFLLLLTTNLWADMPKVLLDEPFEDEIAEREFLLDSHYLADHHAYQIPLNKEWVQLTRQEKGYEDLSNIKLLFRRSDLNWEFALKLYNKKIESIFMQGKTAEAFIEKLRFFMLDKEHLAAAIYFHEGKINTVIKSDDRRRLYFYVVNLKSRKLTHALKGPLYYQEVTSLMRGRIKKQKELKTKVLTSKKLSLILFSNASEVVYQLNSEGKLINEPTLN